MRLAEHVGGRGHELLNRSLRADRRVLCSRRHMRGNDAGGLRFSEHMGGRGHDLLDRSLRADRGVLCSHRSLHDDGPGEMRVPEHMAGTNRHLPSIHLSAADRCVLCSGGRLLGHDSRGVPGTELLDDVRRLRSQLLRADRRVLHSCGRMRGADPIGVCTSGHVGRGGYELLSQRLSAADRRVLPAFGHLLRHAPGELCVRDLLDDVRCLPAKHLSAADRRVLCQGGHVYADDPSGMRVTEHLVGGGNELLSQPLSAADRRVLPAFRHLRRHGSCGLSVRELLDDVCCLPAEPLSTTARRLLFSGGSLHREDAIGVLVSRQVVGG